MRPKKPPVFEPTNPLYWDARDLEEEMERVFSICHGCRMCVGFCESFPKLFEQVDGYVAKGQGEIEAFDEQDYKVVNDLCFQCKLCYFKCPYTPEDDHSFMLDFPRLMLRQKAQHAKRNGVTIQDRALGEPHILGQLGGGPAAGMSNLVTQNQLLRKVQEKTLGISSEFNLPPFARRTLFKWWKHHTPRPEAGERGTVALFSTCTVNYNLPAAGVAAIQVPEHNGFAVDYPKDQTCCGMPNLDGGDVAAAQAKAQKNVDVLLPLVRQGHRVVVPGPTCSYTLRKEYPDLLGTPEATEVANATVDLMGFFLELMKKKELSMEFETSLGNVGYHAPCHLRAQKIGFPAQRILKHVPDTQIATIQECSAVDGTWGMKAQYYDLGLKYADQLVTEMKQGQFDRVATDCPLSGLRLEKELGVTPVHPIELLNDAYGLPAVREADPKTEYGKRNRG